MKFNKKVWFPTFLSTACLIAFVIFFLIWMSGQQKRYITSLITEQIQENIDNARVKPTGVFKKVKVKKIYPAANPAEFWVELTRTSQSSKQFDEELVYKDELWFVDNQEHAVLLKELTNTRVPNLAFKLEHVSPESMVLTQYEEQRDSISMYRSDEHYSPWVLSAYATNKNRSNRILFRFREKNRQYNSGDDDLSPIFDPCDESAIETISYDSFLILPPPMTNLVGVSLESKYIGVLQDFYFAEPIPMQCEKYSDITHGYMPPTGSSLEYVHPYLQIGWPGGITILLDVDQFRSTAGKEGWPNIEEILFFSKDGQPINFKK